MIELRDMLDQPHTADLRDRVVYIDEVEVFSLERAPSGHGIYVLLRGHTWPLHFEVEQLQRLTPIATYLPRTRVCWSCQRPVVYLDGPPPDESHCGDCTQREAQDCAAWEAQRTRERSQIAALEQSQLEALYQEAKAQVASLPPQSPAWKHWRQVQLDASGVLAAQEQQRGAA